MERTSSDTSKPMMEELREKLRISEESRKSLQQKFDVMMQTYRIKEQARYNALKRRYGNFLEEDQRRQQRNENLLQMLDRIDMRTANLAARAERLALLRKHYDQYLGRVYPTWRASSNHRAPASAASVKIRDDPDDDVSGYGTHTGSSGYFRESRRYAEQPRMTPMSTPKQNAPSYKVDNILPDKYRPPRVEFDMPSISVIRPSEDSLNEYRTRNSPIDLRNETREMNQLRMRHEFPAVDTRRERSLPRDARDLQDFSLRDSRNLPDFTRDARDVPDFSPRGARDQSDFSPRGARDHPDFSPRGSRDQPDFSPRERAVRRQQNLAQPELEVDQNTSGDLLNMSLSDDGVSSLSRSEADAEMNRRHHWEMLKQAYLSRSQHVPRDAEENVAPDEDRRDTDWSHNRAQPHVTYDTGPTREEEQLSQEPTSDQDGPQKESFRDKIRRLKIMVQENKKLERLDDAKEPTETARDRNIDENTDENDHLDQGGRRKSVYDTQSSPKPGAFSSQERVAADREPKTQSQEHPQEEKPTRRMSVLQSDQYATGIQKPPSSEETNSEYQRRKSQQWAEQERQNEIQGGRRNSALDNQTGGESQRRQSVNQELLQSDEDKEHYRSRRDVNTERDSVSSYNEQNNANPNRNAGYDGKYPDEQSAPQYNAELRQEFAAAEQQNPLENVRRDSMKQDNSAHITSNPGPDNYDYEGRQYENYSGLEAQDEKQISNNNEGEPQYYQDNSAYVDNREQQHPGTYTGADQNYPPQNYDYNQESAQYGYEQGYPANQVDNTYSRGEEDYKQGQQDYNQPSEQGYYPDDAVYAQQTSNDAGYIPNQEYPEQEGYAHQYDNQGSQPQQQYDNQDSQQQQQYHNPDSQPQQQYENQDSQQPYQNQDSQPQQQYDNQGSQQHQQYDNRDSQQQQQYDNQDSQQQQQYAHQDSQQQQYGGDSMGWAQDPSQRQDEHAQNEQYEYYDQQNQGEYSQEPQSQQNNEYNYQQQDPNQNYGSAAGEKPDSNLRDDERGKYLADDTGGYYQNVSEDSTQNSDLSHERVAPQGQQSPSQRSVDRYRTMLGVDPNSEPSYSEVDEIEDEMAAFVAGGTSRDVQPETRENTNPPQTSTDLPGAPAAKQSMKADTKPPQVHDDSSDFDYSAGP